MGGKKVKTEKRGGSSVSFLYANRLMKIRWFWKITLVIQLRAAASRRGSNNQSTSAAARIAGNARRDVIAEVMAVWALSGAGRVGPGVGVRACLPAERSGDEPSQRMPRSKCHPEEPSKGSISFGACAPTPLRQPARPSAYRPAAQPPQGPEPVTECGHHDVLTYFDAVRDSFNFGMSGNIFFGGGLLDLGRVYYLNTGLSSPF